MTLVKASSTSNSPQPPSLVLASGSLLLLLFVILTLSVSAQDRETDARINLETAKILMKQGDSKGALAKFEEVRKVQGDDPNLLVTMGQLDVKLGNFAAAKNLLDRALSVGDADFQKQPAYELAIQLEAQCNVGLSKKKVHDEQAAAQAANESEVSSCIREYCSVDTGDCGDYLSHLKGTKKEYEGQCDRGSGFACDEVTKYSDRVDDQQTRCNHCKSRCRTN